jgi:hypothetical protein
VNTPNPSLPLRRRSASTRRIRRTTRFALQCEPLESRQLLSVGQTSLAVGVLVNPSVASSQLSIPAIVSNFDPNAFLGIEIEFGAFGGLNQIQIAFLGTSPVFAPTSTSSFGGSGSGFGLGTLTGISDNSGGGNSQAGQALNSGTTSTLLITPLNPNVTSSMNTPGGPPVILVPPPLAPLPVHLGASTLPATNLSDSTLISLLDERPTSVTHFGQADTFEGQRVFMERIDVTPPSSSLIDDIEPFRPIAPVGAPEVQPAPPGEQAPDATTIRPLPAISDPNIDAALDLTDARVLTRSHDADATQADDQLSSNNTSWSFSAIFGAATIAAGGYHLAMREADRFRGRWIPRWLGAERPNKRKTGLPPR